MHQVQNHERQLTSLMLWQAAVMVRSACVATGIDDLKALSDNMNGATNAETQMKACDLNEKSRFDLPWRKLQYKVPKEIKTII